MSNAFPKYLSAISILLSIPFYSLINLPARANCSSPITNEIFKWTMEKIQKSKIVELKELNCKKINEINAIKGEKLLITSGRERGRAIICMSDEKTFPCKYKLATINQGFDSATALSEVFSFTPPVSSQLNETVERLFLKPSLLIN